MISYNIVLFFDLPFFCCLFDFFEFVLLRFDLLSFCYTKINSDMWRTLFQFNIVKSSLDKIKEVFVHSPARRGRYLVHLKMHEISLPCKIPLYNKTHWNSWFRMVIYVKEHIIYWPSFFKEELDNDKKHVILMAINSCLQNKKELGIITIYLNFISFYAKEFIQDLNFFQQLNKPIFPLVELRL